MGKIGWIFLVLAFALGVVVFVMIRAFMKSFAEEPETKEKEGPDSSDP